MTRGSAGSHSVACAVYQALRFGISLPHLHKSQELAEQLLAFHPSSCHKECHQSLSNDTSPGQPEPGRNEARDMSPGQPEPGRNEARDTSPGQPEPGRNEARDTSPGQPEPGRNEARDTSPGQPEPGRNGARDTSPGQPEPGRNGARDTSPGQPEPGRNEARDTSPGQPEPGRNEARDTSPGQPEPEIKGSSFSPSVLMLEALSRKRLDSAYQLHEVCPQLLASIPLFDPTPSVSAQPCSSSTPGFQLFVHRFRGRLSLFNVSHVPSNHLFHSHPPSLSNQPSTSRTPDVLGTEVSAVQSSPSNTSNEHICPHKRTSVLLDLAAEKRSLLVFVLKNHPDVCRRPGCDGSHHQRRNPHAMNATAVCTDHNILADGYKSEADLKSQTSTEENNENDHGDESFFEELFCSENDEDDQEDEDLSTDSNTTSVINICIRKNNPDVLQYLLYKYVWKNFLPHCSIAACCSCDDDMLQRSWWLHCAALTGCPRLLNLVLCGKFDHQCTPVPSSPIAINPFKTSSTHKLDIGTTKNWRSNSLMHTDKDVDSPSGCKRHQSVVIAEPPGHGCPRTAPPAAATDSAHCCRLQQASAAARCPTMVTEPGLHSPMHAQHGNVTHPAIDERTEVQGESSQQASSNHLALSSASPANDSSCAHPMPGFHMHDTRERITTATTPTSPNSCHPSKDRHKKYQHICSSGHGTKTMCNRPASVEQQSPHLIAPDPNHLLPVFLPLKDYYIPTGTHVRLSPLHLACWRCDPASIQMLLDHGADANLITEPLQSSAAVRREHSEQVTHAARSSSSLPLLQGSGSSDPSDMEDDWENIMLRSGPCADRCILSPLTALILGIRSMSRFSLYRGKSLGLVEHQRMGHTNQEREEDQATWDALQALRLLLGAGCDVNANVVFFGEVVRVLDLLVCPSEDMHSTTYLGYHSILLWTLLERMADMVLAVTWELLTCGARLSLSFCQSLQWNLPSMACVKVSDHTLQERFLHLAIFLGLFPPLDPAMAIGGHCTGDVGTDFLGGDKTQISVRPSSASTDLVQNQPSSSPLPGVRSSGIPWLPNPSRISPISRVLHSYGMQYDSVDDEEEVEGVIGNINQYRRTESLHFTATPSQAVGSVQSGMPAAAYSPAFSSPSSSLGSDSSTSEYRVVYQNPENNLSSLNQRCYEQRSSSCHNLSISMMDLWALRNHQQRRLKKFVDDVQEMSVSPACQELILRFLCQSDLRQLSRITRSMLLQGLSEHEDDSLHALSRALSQATQPRTLSHCCKLTVLWAVHWSPACLQRLPLPASVRRYLLSPD